MNDFEFGDFSSSKPVEGLGDNVEEIPDLLSLIKENSKELMMESVEEIRSITNKLNNKNKPKLILDIFLDSEFFIVNAVGSWALEQLY